MLFYGSFTDSQHLCDFLLRNLLHTSQPHDFSALRGQALESFGEQLDLLVRQGALFRGNLIYQDIQLVDIRHRLYGDDTFPSDSIQQQVVGRAEQEGSRGSWPSRSRGRIHASIRLLAQIAYVVASRPDVEQIAHQHVLVREDLAFEPMIKWLVHTPTVRPIVDRRQALARSMTRRRDSFDRSAGYAKFVRLNVEQPPDFRADIGCTLTPATHV